MNKPEVLSPAGSMESVYAAVRSGADAVYLGSKVLNARRSAANFDNNELSHAVRYCHECGVKVYLTLNTMCFDSELNDAVKVIEHAATIGTDAIIASDLGVVSLIRNICPEMNIHASTQMSIQSAMGCVAAKELGISRVVLAREMSFDEIKKAADVGIETEVFVHGALCMCISGQCYISSMIGSRSGNRGLCAQTCRLPFKLSGKSEYSLSLKDMSLIDHVKKLSGCNVSSLKIEGRMKRPEYVAAATACVRAAVDGADFRELKDKLKAIFSRSGFTDGYFTGLIGREMFGTRQKEDVVSADSRLLKETGHIYKNELQRVPVTMELTLNRDEPITLMLSDSVNTVFVSTEVPQIAINRETDFEGARRQMEKLGGTPFFLKSLEFKTTGGLVATAASLNEIRRKAVEALLKIRGEIGKKEIKPFKFSKEGNYKTDGEIKVRARFSSVSQIPEDNINDFEYIILPVHECLNRFNDIKRYKEKIIAELGRAVFSKDGETQKELEKLSELLIDKVMVQNLSQIPMARKQGMQIFSSFAFNTSNTQALYALEKMGVSDATLTFEMLLSKISELYGNIRRGIIAYGYLPLMITRNCVCKEQGSCAECKNPRKHELKDRTGAVFTVMCSAGISEIYNGVPLYMADRLSEISGADFITLYFTSENADKCNEIISLYKNKKPISSGAITRGLYYRGVI